jgi:hypothetical protein
MNFPYFVNKKAPVSGVESLMDYDVTFIGEIKDGQYLQTMKVLVPCTSLCPCSKKISEYGAHNQRSHVTITVRTNRFVWIEDIIQIAEENASSQLYGLLKRPGREVRHREGLRESQVRGRPGAGRGGGPEPGRAHRCVRGGGGELREHPQPQRLRADRKR